MARSPHRPGSARGDPYISQATIAGFAGLALLYFLVQAWPLVTGPWEAVPIRLEELYLKHWVTRGSKGSPSHHYAIHGRYTWVRAGREHEAEAIAPGGGEVFSEAEGLRRIREIRARQPPHAWVRAGNAVYLDPRLPLGTFLVLCGGLLGIGLLWKWNGVDRALPVLAADGRAQQLGSLGLFSTALLAPLVWAGAGAEASFAALFLALIHGAWLAAVVHELVAAPPPAAPAPAPRAARVPLVERVRSRERRRPAPAGPAPPRLVRLESPLDPAAVRCPFCGDDFTGRGMARCRGCQTLHHLDCWKSAETCTTYACGSKEFDRVLVQAVGTTRTGS